MEEIVNISFCICKAVLIIIVLLLIKKWGKSFSLTFLVATVYPIIMPDFSDIWWLNLFLFLFFLFDTFFILYSAKNQGTLVVLKNRKCIVLACCLFCISFLLFYLRSIVFTEFESKRDSVRNSFLILFYAPIIEELMHRKVLFEMIKNHSRSKYVAITVLISLVTTVLHLQNYFTKEPVLSLCEVFLFWELMFLLRRRLPEDRNFWLFPFFHFLFNMRPYIYIISSITKNVFTNK